MYASLFLIREVLDGKGLNMIQQNKLFALILISVKSVILLSYSVKSARIWSYPGPYFPAFGLNMERYSLFSPNAEKYGPEKLRIRTLLRSTITILATQRDACN